MFAGNVLPAKIRFLAVGFRYFSRDRKLFGQSLDTYLAVRRGFLNPIVSFLKPIGKKYEASDRTSQRDAIKS
jgi:hypothetical protein